MAITTNDKNLGHATAYAYAKSKGYTGTEQEFATLMASYGTVAENAEESRQAAEEAQSKAEAAQTATETAQTGAEAAQTGAVNAKDTAVSAASTATTKAGEASSSATSAANSATSAQGSATSASNSATAATTKANEASASATAAATAQGKAETAQSKAEDAQEAAETAQTGAESARDTAVSAKDTAVSSASTATTKAGEASQSATAAAGSAEDSEAWAVGKRDGTDVPSTDDTYHNNSKYWAGEAERLVGEANYAWFDVNQSDGEMYVTMTPNLDEDLSFAINENTGELIGTLGTGRTYSAGVATAYGAAKQAGYTGTYAQFEAALGDLADVLEDFEGFSVTVNTLSAGSSATASYSNGVLTLGIPKGDPGDEVNLAAPYDSTKTYAVGDHCTKDGQYKVCTTEIATAEAWDATHWADAEVGEEISDLKSALNAVTGIPSVVIDLNDAVVSNIYDRGGTWWVSNANQSGVAVLCEAGASYKITANATENAIVSFVKTLPSVSGDSVDYAGSTSRNVISADSSQTFIAPNDAVYLYVAVKSYAHDLTPTSVIKLGETGELDVIKNYIFGGEKSNVLTGVWENGGIGDDGNMLPMKRENNFFRTLRTRNFIKADGFNFTAQSGTLTVFEYDEDFTYLRSSVVTADYTLSADAAYFKLQWFVNDTSNAVSIEIEQGGLDNDGAEIASDARVRTDFLDVDNLGFDSIWFRGIVYGRFYDTNKQIIASGTSTARYNQNKGGLCKISSLIELFDASPWYEIKSQLKYVRLAFSNEVATEAITPSTYDVRFTNGDGAFIAEPIVYVGNFEEVKNNYIDANTMSFGYRVNLVNGHQVNADDATATSNLLDNHQYVTSCMLLLPPNYKPTGKPSKLIIWCHGSGDYSLMGYDLMSNNYMEYLGYWQKEGFAVADMFVRTSKYGSMGGDVNGMPTNTAAYEQGYKWLMDHFNLDDTGVYVSAKSMGGVGALSICYSNIPVKAADLFAPALNPFYQQCGYGIGSRKDYIDDLKLEDADALITDPSPASPMPTANFNALMIANKDRITGYNAYINKVTNKTFDELVVLNFKNAGTYADVVKICDCPFRIHIALDDTTVAYAQSLNLITAMKNSGSVAEIRTMPSGCASPHHAVDNDPNALKATVVTALGYTCENVPLAYAEAASWFKYYE